MIESMLEPHMKGAGGADQMQVSVAFLILGAVYMVISPAAGYVSNTKFVVVELLQNSS